MHIAHESLREELYKTVKGLGFDIKLYDADDKGPIVNQKEATTFYLYNDGIMIIMPVIQDDEIIIYSSSKNNDSEERFNNFKNLISRVRQIGKKYGIGTTTRRFDTPIIDK